MDCVWCVVCGVGPDDQTLVGTRMHSNPPTQTPQGQKIDDGPPAKNAFQVWYSAVLYSCTVEHGLGNPTSQPTHPLTYSQTGKCQTGGERASQSQWPTVQWEHHGSALPPSPSLQGAKENLCRVQYISFSWVSWRLISRSLMGFWDAKPWVFLAPKSQGNYSFHYLKQKVLLEQRVYLAIFLGLLYPYRKTRTLHARELSVNVKLTYIGPVVPSGAQCPSILRNCLLGPSNWGGLMGADPGQALLGEGSHQNPSEQFFKESCQSQFTLKRDFTKDI